MNDLDRLRERIAHGWFKLGDDGSRTVVGSEPHLDLYEAVRSLDSRFPVPGEMSAIFNLLARRIVYLFPQRVQTDVETTYDARIVLFEFNDHPDTTQVDVLQILLPTGKQEPLSERSCSGFDS
jgi:hypothetical protein